MEKQEIVLEATEEKNQEKEIKSRRRPNEKHFRRADGTYEARLFSQPVHYYDEVTDSYEEYHPSFEEKEAEYVAENGSFRVKFGKNMSQEKAIEVSRGGSKVSWHALHWKNDRAPETNVDQFTEAEDVPESAVAKYTSGEEELLYEAGRNYVRESIVIKKKAEEYRYTFLLQTQGVYSEKESGPERIQLYKIMEDTEEKTAVFTIPEPYMCDAAGVCSNAVRYELCEIDQGKYLLQIIADAA